jgi:hypothetical protein
MTLAWPNSISRTEREIESCRPRRQSGGRLEPWLAYSYGNYPSLTLIHPSTLRQFIALLRDFGAVFVSWFSAIANDSFCRALFRF